MAQNVEHKAFSFPVANIEYYIITRQVLRWHDGTSLSIYILQSIYYSYQHVCHVVFVILFQTAYRGGEQLGSRDGSRGSAQLGARVRREGKRGLLRAGSAAGKVT